MNDDRAKEIAESCPECGGELSFDHKSVDDHGDVLYEVHCRPSGCGYHGTARVDHHTGAVSFAKSE